MRGYSCNYHCFLSYLAAESTGLTASFDRWTEDLWANRNPLLRSSRVCAVVCWTYSIERGGIAQTPHGHPLSVYLRHPLLENMECLVGHGSRLSVGGGASGVETRRGRSSAVAANKEYVVAVGGGRRRNKNCGVGVSSVSRRDLLLSLHSVVFSNCRTCEVQTTRITFTIAACNWAVKILRG